MTLALAVVCTPVHAQDAAANRSVGVVASAVPLTLPAGFVGAAPPDLPNTVSRDGDGHTTVRVVKLTAPLRVDGNLDEDLYRTVSPISGLIQVEPRAGAPATEKTEIWLSFDADNIYVTMRASESEPGRMIVNEMRRDSFNLLQNENLQFAFDTFSDKRNAVSFQFNPIGGRMDGQVTGESAFNSDWNPIWRLEVKRDESGWTAEAAVPFKSLRYKPGAAQVWGFQVRRIDRWKNETSYLTELPPNTGINGHGRVALYATMVGLEVPQGGRALDLKPYVTSNVTTDLTAGTPVRNDVGRDFGIDAKYAVTQNLTADLTVNTDFAQVEADEQQVNLTRFSLFFPEKREFFLENQGLFQFAVPNTGGNNTTDTPTIFYSRRIGLDSGGQVPIDAGGRVSGRMGRYSVGVMDIQSRNIDSRNLPTTNFGVVRVKRDLFRRSSIGALYTRRSAMASGRGPGDTYGVDGSFAFFQNLYFNTYWAKAKNAGVSGEDTSYRTQMFYNADRWGVQVERLNVGDNFDPQIGFVRRDDFTKNRAFVRFSPRPRQRFRRVRKFTYQGSVNYFTDSSSRLESRNQNLEFAVDFASSEKLTVQYDRDYERLDIPFGIATGVKIPVGGFNNDMLTAEFQVGQQRRASGTWWLETGSFYNGDRTAFGYRGARVKVNQHLSVEPGISVNRVALPYGNFTANLLSARTTYTFSPLMFVSGLVQYNSGNNSVSTNVRLRWEYQPGSELFVVYNDGRDTTGDRFATLQSRAIVFKINKLFRY